MATASHGAVHMHTEQGIISSVVQTSLRKRLTRLRHTDIGQLLLHRVAKTPPVPAPQEKQTSLPACWDLTGLKFTDWLLLFLLYSVLSQMFPESFSLHTKKLLSFFHSLSSSFFVIKTNSAVAGDGMPFLEAAHTS